MGFRRLAGRAQFPLLTTAGSCLAEGVLKAGVPRRDGRVHCAPSTPAAPSSRERRTAARPWPSAHIPPKSPCAIPNHLPIGLDQSNNWSRPYDPVSVRIQHAVPKRREITGTIRTNATREETARTHSWPGPRRIHPHRTSNPVTARPISIRWISDVTSKIVKILEVEAEPSEYLAADLTCANTAKKGFRSPLRVGAPPPILVLRTGFRPQGRPLRMLERR